MRYATLNKTNTLLTNAMQFMSRVLWVTTKTKCRATDTREVKADWPKFDSGVCLYVCFSLV